MRILSQENLYHIDLPYENVGLSISARDRKTIVAYPSGNYKAGDGFWTMAEYSTEEKAKKAMEMLHEAYTGTFFAQNLELPECGINDLKQLMKHGYGCVCIEKDSQDVRFEPLNICFQFPADDEVEV